MKHYLKEEEHWYIGECVIDSSECVGIHIAVSKHSWPMGPVCMPRSKKRDLCTKIKSVLL